MHVKTTFLNVEVEEEVYIEHLEGFMIRGKDSHVCKLKKAMYGLKQTPQAWCVRIDSYLQKFGFLKSDANSNLYFKVVENQPMVLVLYVDDIFLTREERIIVEFHRDLTLEFEMKDLVRMHYFLGLKIW